MEKKTHVYKFQITLLDQEYRDVYPICWTVECNTTLRNVREPPHKWVRQVADVIYQTIMSMGYLQIEYNREEHSVAMAPVGMIGEIKISFVGEVKLPCHMHLQLKETDEPIKVTDDAILD